MKKVYQIFIMLHKKHNANKSQHSIGWKSRTFTAAERKWKTFFVTIRINWKQSSYYKGNYKNSYLIE